ncbi:Major Facilitator Superfamily protein [Actinopolymorpha cephalotaxi]|uniref:MFS family permease n=1 Tax=Actinopolymorpha cephalotaxi TaxID=504797 RepID=A0A1I2UJC2_9ACTN|nr:MFS transporter [Actinopolymorpha cephalotaxi]NYH86591.1 MFS family permease [Actinopolymorpha cephalotaxi]SFG76439.1 Major Facilitator Superfamily protein [Actinopolymorpha cephalotaxi]
MRFLRDLATLLGLGFFRRLFAVRLVSQFSDGVFQVAIASYVLFSPERQPTAGAIAVGFAVLLLPFSLLGPFCGVLLDRWSRRQTMLWCNAVRAVLVLLVLAVTRGGGEGPLFFLAVLACLSVNRFLLAALSASLPHVVPTDRLVLANAVTPTCGTLAYLVGLGAGSAVAALGWGAPATAEYVVLVVASLGYAASALLVLRIPRPMLGPDLAAARAEVAATVRHVLSGLADGARHVVECRPAAFGLAAIAVQRFFFTLCTVAIILLYRNYFAAGDAAAGIAGLGTAVLVSGLGFGSAALLTPLAVRRIRKEAWIVVLFLVGALVVLVPGTFFTVPAVLATAFVLGLCAQGVKICVDTLVQENVADVYRGRVFSLYDVLFNVVVVLAAACAALALPPTGRSYAVLAVTSVAYVGAAAGYARLTGVRPRPRTPASSESAAE